MRIFSENTGRYFHALATAVARDPASMEQWRCLHIVPDAECDWASVQSALLQMKSAHPDIDCDILHGEDNEVMLISRGLYGQQLFELGEECAGLLGAQRQIQSTLYDMFAEWRAVHELFVQKAGKKQQARLSASACNHDFSALDSWQNLFVEAKKLRADRMPLQVMIVEDDPLTRRLVTNSFKDRYAIITAEDGEEAVANYLMHAPDIVFLDIGLPGANGFDVLSRILESDPDAYVVMFSGNSYLDNVAEALGTGASGFIAKPFRKDKMQHYIDDSALHHHKRI